MPLKTEKLDPQQAISLVLSVYVLGALVYETLFRVSPPTQEILDRADFIICFFFLYDFAVRFHRAESKLHFMRWGWIDLISSIPFWGGGLQWARIARLVRILRALRSTKILVGYLYRDTSRGTLFTVVLMAFLMMIFSSISILNFETDPRSNIRNPEDALWWAFTTISTVGNGDKYPVTTGGRLTAVALITCGVGLFGVYTAFIAKLFVAEDQKVENTEIRRLAEEVRLLRLKVEAMASSPQRPRHEDDEDEEALERRR